MQYWNRLSFCHIEYWVAYKAIAYKTNACMRILHVPLLSPRPWCRYVRGVLPGNYIISCSLTDGDKRTTSFYPLLHKNLGLNCLIMQAFVLILKFHTPFKRCRRTSLRKRLPCQPRNTCITRYERHFHLCIAVNILLLVVHFAFNRGIKLFGVDVT